MAKIGDYNIRDFYQGGYSSLSPIPKPIYANELGMATDPRVANIVKDTAHKIASGVKTIEISQTDPSTFDSIPKENLEETRRLFKLAGVEPTFHAPIIEPSGITQQGFTETNREEVERQMMQAIKRASVVSPDKNMPVTFHSSSTVPTIIKPKDKEKEEIYVINSYSGEIGRIPIRPKKWPGEEEKTTPEGEIKQINEDIWSDKLKELNFNLTYGSDYFKNSMIKDEGQDSLERQLGKQRLEDSYRQLKELYNMAYVAAEKNKNEQDKKILDNLYKNIQKDTETIKKNPKDFKSFNLIEKIIKEGIDSFEKLSSPPQIYQPIEDFAKEKTVETFSNLAVGTYNEFVKKGKKAPIISIENPPAGTSAFSTGEELKDLVEESQKKFVEKMVKQGVSKKVAEKQAKQLLGVTWDVGHINMLRKHGYSEKDILEQSAKVAPHVKHIHLSDNFGMEHTELPMGMGNVPMKEILEKLGEKGYEAKKIIEAGNWWQHFSEQGINPPFQQTLENFGSPIYSEGVGPYWNQVIGLQQGYFGGYGLMLPQGNYNTFGAGFSQLPTVLGGRFQNNQRT